MIIGWTPKTRAAGTGDIFVAGAVVVCPAIGWLIGFVWVGGTDPEIIGIALFFGVPALLAASLGVVLGRSVTEVVLAGIGAVALTGLSWVITIYWMASEGAFS